MEYDVIIIGAGASGLMAAWELAQAGKNAAIIEARERIGGRIHTIHHPGFDHPVEAGAEFVHGKLDLTEMIREKAGLGLYEVNGDMWQKDEDELQEQKEFIEDYPALKKKFRELDRDIPVAKFMKDHLKDEKYDDLRFTLKNYVEGYYAADTKKSSSFALRDELENSSEKQYRLEEGYSEMIRFLYERCKEKRVVFYLSSPVRHIRWQKDLAEVITPGNHFNSKKILVTVPIGVLQSGAIRFTPALPKKHEAVKKLGFGPVIKTILQFETVFWKNKQFTQGKNLEKMSFIFSQATIPTWWTNYPKQSSMITGWSGGPHADKLKGMDEQQIIQKALESLEHLFDLDLSLLEKLLKKAYVANWPEDEYSCGGYSYEVVNGQAYQEIVKQPVDNTLFFAGEGLVHGSRIGTVEAALCSGRETAHQMISVFKN